MTQFNRKNLYFFLGVKIIFIFCLFLNGCMDNNNNPVKTDSWEQIVNLEGNWKFNIGDDNMWKNKNFDDSKWENLKVPGAWEDQGFHGYNGYAWYRKSFTIPDQYKGKNLYLHLGFIDDADQTFVNGHLIGMGGKLPPNFQTAYNIFRKYPLSTEFLNPNSENVIAVRVYDSELQGGILRGDVGIYFQENYLQCDISFEGIWQFRTGDNLDWKSETQNDSNWTNIMVPGYWETQGFSDYNGYAWYKKEVFVPADLNNDQLVLTMGKIDDYDEVFINDKVIGSTGEISHPQYPFPMVQTYNELRGYYIPKGIIKFNQKNIITVRVFDGFQEGGIYQGPIGIVTQKKYTDYWKQLKDRN